MNYLIEAPGVGYYTTGMVASDSEVIVTFAQALVTSSHNDQDKGIHLMVNSDRVTVIGQNLRPYSSDTFLCMPIQNLCVDKYVYYGISVPRPNILEGLGAILVVGTENDTMINLTTTQSVTVTVSDTTVTLSAGIQYSFVINRLQTVLMRSLDDLTGTKIITDKQVSVLSGHECGRVPSNVDSCEHLVEQLPPTAVWGRIHYTAPLPPRQSYTIKIIAAYNSTAVYCYCNNQRETYNINEGESFNKTLSMRERCAIYSSKDILMVQFSHGDLDDNFNGDPIMVVVPATNYYDSKFLFSTLQGPEAVSDYNFENHISIIVLAQYYQPDMIYLISRGVSSSLDTAQWVPIMVDNVIRAYSVQVAVSRGVAEVVHQRNNGRMSILVYGWGFHHSYGHLAGYSFFGPSTGYCLPY